MGQGCTKSDITDSNAAFYPAHCSFETHRFFVFLASFLSLCAALPAIVSN